MLCVVFGGVCLVGQEANAKKSLENKQEIDNLIPYIWLNSS